LLSALRYLVNNNKLNSDDTIGEVDFGWEVASTGGAPMDFGVTGYSTSSARQPPPKIVQPPAETNAGVLWAYIGGLLAVFVALFTLAMALFGKFGRAGRDRALSGMISKYGPRRQPVPAARTEPEESGKMATAAVSAVDRMIPSGTQERLA